MSLPPFREAKQGLRTALTAACALLALGHVQSALAGGAPAVAWQRLSLPEGMSAEQLSEVGQGFLAEGRQPSLVSQSAEAVSEDGFLAPPRRQASAVSAVEKEYLYSFADNAWRIVSGPLRFDRDDWINVAIVVGATGGVFLLDETLRDFWQDNVRSDSIDDVTEVIEHLGDLEVVLLGSAAAYGLAEVVGSDRDQAAALSGFQTVVLLVPIISGLKYAIGRERPFVTEDARAFSPFNGDNFYQSMPSGHATYTFGLATVASEVYGETDPWVPWVAYPIAAAVSLGRFNDDRHWASDVVLGGLIGHFVGKMVVEYSPFLQENGLSLVPMAAPEGQAVALKMKF